MSKIRRHRYQGEVRNRFEEPNNNGYNEYDNSGNFLKHYRNHHKNVRRPHNH